jgi:hypothetical protein
MVSDSKSDVRKHRGFKSLPLRHICLCSLSLLGEVTERPKVHDWKSCVLKGTEGSNPSLSATVDLRSHLRNTFYGPG